MERLETCNYYAETCLRDISALVSHFDPASSSNQKLWRRSGGTFCGLTIGENAAKMIHPLLSCWQEWAAEEDCGWEHFAATHEFPVQYAGFIEESWHGLVYRLSSSVLNAIWLTTSAPDSFPFVDLRFHFPWELVDASWVLMSAAARLDNPGDGFGPLTTSSLALVESSLRQEYARVCAAKPSRELADPDGWDFSPGVVRYTGAEIPVSGIPRRLLEALAMSTRPLTRAELVDSGWPGDQEQMEANTLDKHLSDLRRILRESLGLPEKANPVPCAGRGRDAAWKLAVKEFCDRK